MENDVLSQEQSDLSFAEDLFAEEDTPIESVEETEPQVSEEPTEPTPEVTEPFLTIRYNKEDVGLSRDEAIELAEKGKNYDKLYGRYNDLNDELSKLARMNDMSVEDYISSLNDTQFRFEVNREMQALMERFPDASEEVLTELAQRNAEARLNTQLSNFNQEKEEQADAQTLEIRRQLGIFREEYPNLEPDKLDRGVYDLVKRGYTLLEAYNKWARQEAERNRPAEEAKAKTAKLNEDNMKKSLGNISSVESDDSEDAFFEGLNSI